MRELHGASSACTTDINRARRTAASLQRLRSEPAQIIARFKDP
jgi:hypothetical protein